MKIQFFHFIFLNITIFLCLQIGNKDYNKGLMSISPLYYLTIGCVKSNGQKD